MKVHRITVPLLFIGSTCIILSLLAANFYSEIIRTFFETYSIILPIYIIPLVSTLITIGLIVMFWIRQAESDRLKYEFITIVTHKFRTPLTGMKWAIEALRGETTIEQRGDILKQVQKTNERLMEIVDLLVNFVKFDKGFGYAYQATDIRELVDISLQKYGEQVRHKNISFKIGSARDLPLLVIDTSKIQFAIDMLIDNAVKYTPSGGTITIDFVSNKEEVTISVKDTGIGMSSADLKKVFKPFFRSNEAKIADTEGMGLGLSTVQRIIEKHEGRIWAISDGLGKGSTFFIQLPVVA